jgi:glycosyltransferase involved in cell wall biosynthesis
LHIACLIHSLNGGGAERVMAGLASRLSERSHRVTLLTLDDARADKHGVAPAVQRVPLDVMGESRHPLQAVWNNWHRRNRLRTAIGDLAPDVVLSFCDRTNVLALLAIGSLGIPVVVAERSDPRFQPIGRGWDWLRRHHYRRAARLVALTPASAAAMQGWHAAPVTVIPSAIELPPPSPQTDTSSDAPSFGDGRKHLLAVGRLAREKGFDRLLDSFANLAPHHPAWDLWIAGEGPERDALLRQRQRRGLEGRVELLGWQSEIAPWYRRADLFVLPSRYEGFPSALLEAMAGGLACVAIDCPSGPRAILVPDRDGLLVPPQPASALHEPLDRLMRDAQLRQQFGEAGRRRAADFGWPAMVDAYENLLREVVAEASASPHPAPPFPR